jgi:cytochrome c-type biogenesis protein CcmH/NrfG
VLCDLILPYPDTEKKMSKRNAKNTPTMLKKSAMILAATTFVVGFFTGVGFTVYKTGSTTGITSNQGQDIDYDQRAKMLEAEVAKNQRNTAAWIQLGHVYFDTDQYKKAIDAYEKALELDPKNGDVWTDLGIMYRRSGLPRKAIECFDRAVVVDPKHETARFNKGIVLMHDLDDKGGAIAAWEDLLSINPLAMAANNQSVDQLIKHYKEGHEKNATN